MGSVREELTAVRTVAEISQWAAILKDGAASDNHRDRS